MQLKKIQNGNRQCVDAPLNFKMISETMIPGFIQLKSLQNLISRYVTGWIVFVVFFIPISCGHQHAVDSTSKPSPVGIHRSFEHGPLMCSMDLDKSEMTIADRLHLTITIEVDENYEIEWPRLNDKLARFGIVDDHTTPPEWIGSNKKKMSRSYVLEPFLSGDYIIPAMKIHFWKTGEKGREDHELETEEIKITVKSILPENFNDIHFHDIQPPVEMPVFPLIWIWAACIMGIGCLAGVVVWMASKGRRHRPPEGKAPLSPHEKAFDELDKLMARNLIERGEIRLFYYEITRIIRKYIEDRFGINAPEQTTEEFLERIRTDNEFPEPYRALLKNFLMHCDLVKFAALQPAPEDIENTVNSCKEFIIQTRIKETGP